MMPLSGKYGRLIVGIAGLGVAVMGGELVGNYSTAGMNSIYTQARYQSILADEVRVENDLFSPRPAAYGVADPADEPSASLAPFPRDLPAADTPGV